MKEWLGEHPSLCYKEIWVSATIRVPPSGTFFSYNSDQKLTDFRNYFACRLTLQQCVYQSVSNCIGLMHRCKNVLKLFILVTLYFFNVFVSHFLYCKTFFWTSTNITENTGPYSKRLYKWSWSLACRLPSSYPKKVKGAHTWLPSIGFRSWSRFLAVSLQVPWVV